MCGPRPTYKKTAIHLSFARQDKRFPKNRIRVQSSIKCKQMESVDLKLADPQININAVPRDFFVRVIEGKIDYIAKRSDKYLESAIKSKLM